MAYVNGTGKGNRKSSPNYNHVTWTRPGSKYPKSWYMEGNDFFYKLRAIKGYSMPMLAETTGLYVNYLQKIEWGQVRYPKQANIIKLAKVFDLDEKELRKLFRERLKDNDNRKT